MNTTLPNPTNHPQTGEPGCCVKRLVRPWTPSNMVIKATGERLCDNEGCMAPATVAFEQDDAVWLACDDCTPGNVTLTKLRPNK
jgi:hypothetical protein